MCHPHNVPDALRPRVSSRADLELMDLLSNRSRMVLVRELARHGAQTTGQLHESIGGDRAALLRNLRALEDEGIVTADFPRDRRSGKTLTWTLNDAALTTHLEDLGEFLRGR